MSSRYVLVATAGAILGAVVVSGASTSSHAKPADETKPDAGQKSAVFNMASVMWEFNQAKYQVWVLNQRRSERLMPLQALRAEHAKLETTLREKLNQPKDSELTKQVQELARQIEDKSRELDKQTHDDASVIINDLYDMIKAAVDSTAKKNGFQIVFAYPDASTAAELKSPYIKELKLKPPAAQPFYVAPEADITARVIEVLNEKHPPIDPNTGQPIDVSTIPSLPRQPGAPARPMMP
ncbi:OmpH family outer membrane protein [Gemmata sp. JC673]|uniref:OmpH family outer membrane protein n=1 Tax=Gemmata algarum TaxID=2975278 RepID=A0ABU5F9G4_9BACT|nr:OmpH family outer membrane protein [Gemmata algarum]MDY3562484.1 OmpH family outer membrane protein [Gemmata algarum]